MSWDKKTRGRQGGYYYRSVRIKGRAVKQYVGAGPGVEMAAALDETERRRRRSDREAWHAQLLRIATADLVLHDLGVACDLLATAVLVALGFHHHRGEWRYRRGREGKRNIIRRPRGGSGGTRDR